MHNRLKAESTRADLFASRMVAMEERLTAAEMRANTAVNQRDALQHEIAALEVRLFKKDGTEPTAVVSRRVDGAHVSLLYVGGRRKLFDRLLSPADERRRT